MTAVETSIPTRDGRVGRLLVRGAEVLALLVVLQAVLALLAEAAGVLSVRRYIPGSRVMSEATALVLALTALAIGALARPGGHVRRSLGIFAAAAAVALAGFMLGHELLTALRSPRPLVPLDWIAPNTAVASILLGTAVLLLASDRRRTCAAREALALGAGLIGFVAQLGYIYGVTELYWLAGSNAMPFPAALAVITLATALVLVRGDCGLGALLAAGDVGGQLARRMLPAAVLIPPVLGLLRVAGEHAGYFDSELGTALLIAASVVFFAGATVWSAATLGRVDVARRASTAALREESHARELERRRLRAVLDVLPVGVMLADAGGHVVEVSPAAKRIFGDPTGGGSASPRYERLRGFDAVTGSPLARQDWALSCALESGRPELGQEIDVETFDGAKKTVLASAATIRDERARIAGGVQIVVDITARKRSERELESLKSELEERVRQRTAELEAANAELEAFSYSVSHDLRAPLRWIDGFARALEEEHAAELGDSGREYLHQLRDSVRGMRELIDALLELARVTAQPLERRPVDLGAIAHEIAVHLESENGHRRVEWRIAHGITVDADPRLLRVVLDNLLRNAWKFTRGRDPARIEVGAEGEGEQQVLYVCDDGVGFDPQYADRLFRPFERLHPRSEYEGSGVGLALVRRIVLRHGGRVWARSEPGRGARICFTLRPRSDA